MSLSSWDEFIKLGWVYQETRYLASPFLCLPTFLYSLSANKSPLMRVDTNDDRRTKKWNRLFLSSPFPLHLKRRRRREWSLQFVIRSDRPEKKKKRIFVFCSLSFFDGTRGTIFRAAKTAKDVFLPSFCDCGFFSFLKERDDSRWGHKSPERILEW